MPTELKQTITKKTLTPTNKRQNKGFLRISVEPCSLFVCFFLAGECFLIIDLGVSACRRGR